MATGYTFPILDSSGAATSTSVDMSDMFVPKALFLNSGLWAWGVNGNGQLGQNNTTSRSSPAQVGTLTDWRQVAGGSTFTMSVKTDGTLWAWGTNTDGCLGQGDVINRSSPIQVGTLTNWQLVSAGKQVATAAAVKTDGTLWTWGNNYAGQLGLGDVTHRSSPVQVGSLTNWRQVVCAVGFTATIGNHTAAVKTDGTLWTWGKNWYGELGQGTPNASGNNNISSPVQVGTLTDWRQVSAGYFFTAAVKTDGTLWAWGLNTNGLLGQGNLTTRSSPVQVGTLTDWRQVTCGYTHIAAIKTDGTLWAWGTNTDGQLGQSDVTHRSSPVQVGALTNWRLVASGFAHTSAVKTDGTLWAWGFNNFGQLGLGDVTHRSSPVQVGSLTNWQQIAGGYNYMAAISSPNLP